MLRGILGIAALAAAVASGASPSRAGEISAPLPQLAQADQTKPAPAAKTPSKKQTKAKPQPAPQTPAERAEARLAELHKRLAITEAQAQQWDAFAKVMRENAAASQAIYEERAQRKGTLTAVDTLRIFQRMTETNAEGVKRLVPAFETLYAALSPEQQAKADQIFGEFGSDRGRGSAGGKSTGKSNPKPPAQGPPKTQ